jgi:hypothetical protein
LIARNGEPRCFELITSQKASYGPGGYALVIALPFNCTDWALGERIIVAEPLLSPFRFQKYCVATCQRPGTKSSMRPRPRRDGPLLESRPVSGGHSVASETLSQARSLLCWSWRKAFQWHCTLKKSCFRSTRYPALDPPAASERMSAQAAAYRLLKPRIINDIQTSRYLVTSKTMLSRIRKFSASY